MDIHERQFLTSNLKNALSLSRLQLFQNYNKLLFIPDLFWFTNYIKCNSCMKVLYKRDINAIAFFSCYVHVLMYNILGCKCVC